MDALFAVLFAVYVIVSIVGALARAGRGVPRGAGAPWPSLPTLPPTGPASPVPSGPSRPVGTGAAGDDEAPHSLEEGATAEDMTQEGTTEGAEAERVWTEGVGGEDLAGEGTAAGGEAPGGEGVAAESQEEREWQSLEGESIEWSEGDAGDAGVGGGWAGPREDPGTAAGEPGSAVGARDAAAALAAAVRVSTRLQGADLARAIVASEILGPPRALSRGPRPRGPRGFAGVCGY